MTTANPRILPALGAFNAMLALAFGTFAAHGLSDGQARDWVMTGVLFQLPHAVAVFAILGWDRNGPARLGAWALAIGALIFAGTLYLLALGGPRTVALMAPAGGTAMMLGWGWIALVALGGERFARLLR
jgi:uncharacterized membrane protein YgdD (TMEM256/DUF423 family)